MQAGDLSARQHVVSDGDLLIHDLLHDAAVYALVVAAEENEVVVVPCQLLGDLLVQHPSAGG